MISQKNGSLIDSGFTADNSTPWIDMSEITKINAKYNNQ